jgi:phage-related protein (TIGR01555 family)
MTDIEALESVLVDRATFAHRAGLQFGGKRDLWEALGYPKTPSFHDYCSRYDRQDIARRIVDQPIRATWREHPTLSDTDDADEESPFQIAWDKLVRKHRIIDRLKRVDTLAALGDYAVLLVGLKGQDDFEQPVIRGAAGEDGLLYLAPYSEPNAQIDRHEEDPTSPRFGWPVLYSLEAQIITGQTTTSRAARAHWTRVIHVSNGNLENDIVGKPALQPVINLLDDLIKVVGGSAETYWGLAKSPLHANLDPKARPLSKTEKAEVKTQIDEIQHDLRRVMYSSGLDLNYLSSGVADPRGPFEVILKLISAATGIPQRMLTGSEAGELASSQDDKNFADRVVERQLDYAEPKILRPLVDLLVTAGVLPEPDGGDYDVEWGSLADPDESERAATTKAWADAAQGFSNAASIIDAGEVRERYFGLPAEHPNPPDDSTDEENNNDDEVNNNT